MTVAGRPEGRAAAGGRREYLVAAAVLAVVLGVFFGPVLFGGKTFSAVSDLQQYVHPWQAPGPTRLDPYAVSAQIDQANYVHPRQVFLEDALRTDRRVPFWNPLTFGGHSFVAESGSRLAYPPLLQLSVLFDATWAHDLYVVLHLFAAGIAAFALMRTLGVGLAGGLLTAVAWAVSSYATAWIMLEMFAAPAALLPIGLLCVRRWHDRRTWAPLLAGAFVMGLLFLGTTVELALFCFLCVGGYAGCLALQRVVQEWGELTPRGRVGALAAPVVLGLVALAVAAVALLPFLELSDASERAATSPWSREISSVPFRLFRHVLTPPPVPSGVFAAVGYLISAQVFVGTATAVLAAVGLFLRRPGAGLGRTLLIVLFLFTVGSPVTSFALLLIPRLSALNGFGRSLFLFDLGLAILGGLGLDALLRWLRARGERAPDGRDARTWTLVGAAIATVCIATTATQLVAHARRLNPPLQPREAAQLYPPTPAVEAVRSLIGTGPGRGRIVPVSHPAALSVLHGATNMALDLPSAGGYEPVLPGTVTKLARVVAGEPIETALTTPTPRTFLAHYTSNLLRTELLGRTGITAVLGSPDLVNDPSWGPSALAGRGLRLTYSGPDAAVYRVMDPPPRATVVTDASWVGSSAEALRRFVDRSFDGRRQVVLEGDQPRQSPARTPALGASTVEWLEDRPDQIRLAVNAAQPGWLVLLDGFDTGWKASVAGRGAEVFRANYNFRAVAVPAGSSTVEFSYRPASVALGARISALATVLVAVGMVPEWARRRRAARRARRQASSPPPSGVDKLSPLC